MIPKFSSQTDMIGFIRALPQNANYSKMLMDDFGIQVPANALAHQKEYLWKYLVQGTYLGKDQSELMKYAVDGVERLQKMLPHITMKDVVVTKPAVSNKIQEKPEKNKPKVDGRTKRHSFKHVADGTVMFLEHRGKWAGCFGGRVVCLQATEEKARIKLNDFISAKKG